MNQKLTKEDLEKSGGNLQKTQQWKGASEKLQQEKQGQAQSVNEFADYEELNGVKIYCPRAKHKWALAAFAQEDNPVVNGMVGGYILSTPAGELDKIFIESKNGTLESKALDFATKFEKPDELGEVILRMCNQGASDVAEDDPKNS